jgi:hypothetical protein
MFWILITTIRANDEDFDVFIGAIRKSPRDKAL